MQFQQPLPFHMIYPILLPFDPETDQERDLQRMKSYYSQRAARIQEMVERECDRMEYDGSMMFDEYPDRFMMEHLCLKIQRELDENSDENLRDLIGVLLFNEMYRRRCNRRRRRRF